MVTIEQKLSMFSKLLHRSMNDKFTEEMEKLRSEYAEKLAKNREEADSEAEDILRRSLKRAEAEKTEIASRSRINIKKAQMEVRERLFNTMLSRLTDRIRSFILSQEYGGYIASITKKLACAELTGSNLIILMTQADIDKHGELLKKELGEQQRELEFRVAGDDIIGGFIAIDTGSGIRMDFSIKTLLEDNHGYIMQELFRALDAGGAAAASNGSDR
ncbi:MAG TPA: V-type ATP synthase subunit E [Clostridia bacterium]|nr:V-type ATP synthase subunit E [Clostridia bacterium]